MWYELILNNGTVADYIEVIEDALCYGFEFKVENHRIFWRECCTS